MDELYEIFYLAFLMPFSRITKIAFEEVMGTKLDKSLLLLAVFAFQHLLYSCCQIVICNDLRNSAEKTKGIDMPLKKSFLLLMKESFDKNLSAIGATHTKDLNFYLLTL
ncbi:hypothetical protein AV540_25555 [Brevibacillus parabrevis]|nr:hypothetical protein AV540_25555 [Brevibacillus parabrevis]